MNTVSQLETEIQNAHSQHQTEIERVKGLEAKAHEDLQQNIDETFTLAFQEIRPRIEERVKLYEEAEANKVDNKEVEEAREFLADIEARRYKKAMKKQGPVTDMLLKERNRATETIRKADIQARLPQRPITIPIRLHNNQDGAEPIIGISYPASHIESNGLLGYIDKTINDFIRYEKPDSAEDAQETLLSKLSENKDLNTLFRFRVFVTGSTTSTSQLPEPEAVPPAEQPGKPQALQAKDSPEITETIYTVSTRELAERIGEDYKVLGTILSHDPVLKEMREKRGVSNFYTEEAVEVARERFAGKFDKPKPADTDSPKPGSEEQTPPETSAKKARMSRNRKIKQMAVSGIGTKDIADEIEVSRGTVEKALKDMGIYSWRYIQTHFNTIDKIRNADIEGVDCFTDPEKQKARNNLVMMVLQYVKEPIRYLGLEGGNMASYIELCRNFTVNRRGSMIVERNEKTYHVLRSFKKNRKFIRGGEIFNSLNIRKGTLAEVVDLNCGEYNTINLDYMGVLNDEKMRTLISLFDRGQIADNAVLAITLNNHELSLKRFSDGSSALGKHSENGFKSDDQYGITKEILGKLSETYGFNLTELDSMKYQGKHTPMLYMCFKLDKKEAALAAHASTAAPVEASAALN